MIKLKKCQVEGCFITTRKRFKCFSCKKLTCLKHSYPWSREVYGKNICTDCHYKGLEYVWEKINDNYRCDLKKRLRNVISKLEQVKGER